MSTEQLTVEDALTIVFDCAQSCRENGDTDMRNIQNCIRGVRRLIAENKSRGEIIEAYSYGEDDE